jgi:hypothetical protein
MDFNWSGLKNQSIHMNQWDTLKQGIESLEKGAF